MTPNQIHRTAFKYLKQGEGPLINGVRYKGSVDTNNVCPYCKNQDTEAVRDSAVLDPFKKYYGDKAFKVVFCPACEAVFSYSKP